MTTMTQLEKVAKYRWFKVPNSEVIWQADFFESHGVSAIHESAEYDESHIMAVSRWFTEGDLKDATFYQLTPIIE